MKSKHRLQLLCTLALALIHVACSRQAKEPDSPTTAETRDDQLLRLPVSPEEVVMADRQVPVPLVDMPCLVPAIQGIERYADVGWVAPRFFLVRSETSPRGYNLTVLPDGRIRFTARFRSPRSEREAVELFHGQERGSEKVLFCDVLATLRSLKETPFKRLAAWPTNGIKASIHLNQRYELTVDLRDWLSTEDVVVSTVLERSDATVLQRELQSPLGAQVQFDVYSQWRRSGCIQSVDLTDIRVAGLRDGETGAVPLSEIKRSIMTLLAKDTNVDVTGDCGTYSFTAPATPDDNRRFLSCSRNGNSLQCRYEGEFQVTPAVYTTETQIGERVAGVF